MEYSEFFCSVLTNLCKTKRNLGNRNLNNYASIVVEFPVVAIDLLNAFDTDGSLCLAMFVDLVKDFTTSASEGFPKSTAQLPNADLGSQVQNRQQKKVSVAHCVNHRDSFLGDDVDSFPFE